MPGRSHSEQRETGGADRLSQLLAENTQLRQLVEQLQRRLGLDSSNSGKPPSSDGPAKPPAQQRTRSPGTKA